MDNLSVLSAYDEKLIQEIDYMSDDELQKMIKNSYALFVDRQVRIPKHKRIAILEKVVSLLESAHFEFVRHICLEGGKPIKDATIEVNRAIDGVKMAIHHLSTKTPNSIPMGLTESTYHHLAVNIEQPKGMVLGISAFNHPLNMIVHQIIPSFAAGCPIIIKPSLKTPLTGIKFVELLYKAGVPQSYCQVAICKDSQLSSVISDPKFSFISFVGAADVGWRIKNDFADGVEYILEHGGAAPVIIHKDADIKKHVGPLAKAAFYHAGQVCVSAQRIYIHDEIFEEFSNQFAHAVEQLIVGDPLNEDTDVGPLISYLAVEKIDSWIKEAIDGGGVLKTGGKRLSRTCYEPTIILNPPESCHLATKEAFGPVVGLYTYNDLDEVIKKANGLPFAFQSSIYSANIDTCLKVAHELEATSVMVNEVCAFRADWMPFGGYKESGHGMAGIPQSIDKLYREKLVVIKSDSIV
jgi:acyl-CoA reductase-like NAD-dependent aldehyde dehydrogenase